MERNIYKIEKKLFITSDEEIKEGDLGTDGTLVGYYGYDEDGCPILKDSKHKTVYSFGLAVHAKKIILTTDPDLIKDGIQAIPDEFLEWFVKNPSCEEVEVNKVEGRHVDYGGNVHSPISYKIIIPQEEAKQETLEEAAERLWLDPTSQLTSKNSFIQGAKWQAKRMYSEEEVLKLLYELHLIHNSDSDMTFMKVDEWFEQFKKK